MATQRAFAGKGAVLMARLGVRRPLVLAPMLGVSTPELVAAVAGTGALAFLPHGTADAATLPGLIARTQALLAPGAAFGVNLFVPSGCYTDRRSWTPVQRDAAASAQARQAAWLGLGCDAPPMAPAGLGDLEANLERQVAAIIAGGVRCVSLHFGWLPAHLAARLRDAGIVVVGCATNLDEALHLVQLGADCVVAQGREAGGHRGTFLNPDRWREDGMVGCVRLVREIATATDVPVIAAGGIMDGRGIVAAIEAGACAAQCGTAFLPSPEAATHPLHRAALLSSAAGSATASGGGGGGGVAVTKVLSGKPAQGLRTEWMASMADLETALPNCFNGVPLGRTVAARSATANDFSAMTCWAGAGHAECRDGLDAAQLARLLVQEADETVGQSTL